jgi:hypothetical protein
LLLGCKLRGKGGAADGKPKFDVTIRVFIMNRGNNDDRRPPQGCRCRSKILITQFAFFMKASDADGLFMIHEDERVT